MSLTREQICQQTSKKLLTAAPTMSSIKAMIGLDGFVDEIIGVVDKRASATEYTLVKTIDALGKKILHAAGQSSNYEMLVKQVKLGGNGPIMANAMASAGLGVTYVGNLGYPSIHPVFEEFTKRAKVISIAEPGTTEALEFEDGKLMLGKHQTLKDVNWDNLVSRVGLDALKKILGDATFIGMVNWTMLPHMSAIWSKLLTDIFPLLPKTGRTFFVDLADPEKRTNQDLLDAMNTLTKFQQQADVILGLNLKEAVQVAEVLGIAAAKNPEDAIEEMAVLIRNKIDIGCVVIHPRSGAAAATIEHSAKFKGPFVQQPKISTGAGDHFNAGFCLGRVLGLTLEESLCTGVGTSGYYVRTANSPSANQLAEFVADLPAPQA